MCANCVDLYLRDIREQAWFIGGKGKDVSGGRGFVNGFEQDSIAWARNKNYDKQRKTSAE